MLYDLLDCNAVGYLSEHKRTTGAHFGGIPCHDFQIRTNGGGKVRFVNHQQIRLGNPRPTLSRNFVTTRHIDHIYNVIRQFAAEIRGQIVATGFYQQQLGTKRFLQILQRQKIRGYILANGRMWATARLHGHNSLGWQSGIANQKFSILLGENIIRDGGDIHGIAQSAA